MDVSPGLCTEGIANNQRNFGYMLSALLHSFTKSCIQLGGSWVVQSPPALNPWLSEFRWEMGEGMYLISCSTYFGVWEETFEVNHTSATKIERNPMQFWYWAKGTRNCSCWQNLLVSPMKPDRKPWAVSQSNTHSYCDNGFPLLDSVLPEWTTTMSTDEQQQYVFFKFEGLPYYLFFLMAVKQILFINIEDAWNWWWGT